jgi:hypothetical protein
MCGVEMDYSDWKNSDGICSVCLLFTDQRPKKKKKDVEDRVVKKISIRKPGIREEFRRLEENRE